MKILIVLTYYRPHISGLTFYAERLAKAFAARGHQVTVLTSQFSKDLAAEEVKDGVHIIRAPVLFRLSKGVIMPTFGSLANRLVKANDVIQLHLPQFDAAGVALRGRILKKPTVITYHCDLLLPPGLFNRIANLGVKVMNNLAALFTHRIVTYTQDYADHSSYTNRYMKKVEVIPPPVILPGISHTEIVEFGHIHNPENKRPVIGMAARLATEKGVEVLLKAMPEILEQFPGVIVQFVGPYQDIIGEEDYYARLEPEISKYQESGHWQFLGSLAPEQMAAFFPNLDCLVLPSLNSTEAFGLVQIEAMMNGVFCIASNLPGVRQPVTVHKMGYISEIGNSSDLAQKIILTLKNSTQKKADAHEFDRYSPDAVAQSYEALFAEIQQEIRM